MIEFEAVLSLCLCPSFLISTLISILSMNSITKDPGGPSPPTTTPKPKPKPKPPTTTTPKPKPPPTTTTTPTPAITPKPKPKPKPPAITPAPAPTPTPTLINTLVIQQIASGKIEQPKIFALLLLSILNLACLGQCIYIFAQSVEITKFELEEDMPLWKNKMSDLTNWWMGVSGVMSLVSIIAFIGACIDHKCLTKITSFITFLLAFMVVAIILINYFYKTKVIAEFNNEVKNEIRKFGRSGSNQTSMNSEHNIQVSMKCCGWNGIKDYQETNYKPTSCDESSQIPCVHSKVFHGKYAKTEGEMFITLMVMQLLILVVAVYYIYFTTV